MITCNACGAENPVQHFCGNCGAELSLEEATKANQEDTQSATAPAMGSEGAANHLPEESEQLPSTPHTVPASEISNQEPEKAAPVRTRRRWMITTALVAAILIIGAGAFLMSRDSGPSQEERYLQDIKDAGLMGEFAADRAAVANATKVCADLDGGAKPQGSEADRIGVEHYCADYADVFKVLRTKQIEGTFVIIDADSAGYSDGSSCQGDGGFGDLNASTAVVVKNNDGDILARTELGPGAGDGVVSCTFTFNFELTEGEDQYVVLVGDRGEITYTWAEISRPGAIALSIG